MTTRRGTNRLKKRPGRDVGKEKAAEHQRVEALFAREGVGGGDINVIAGRAGEAAREAAAHFLAHE